jgi:hypothetical protein
MFSGHNLIILLQPSCFYLLIAEHDVLLDMLWHPQETSSLDIKTNFAVGHGRCNR